MTGSASDAWDTTYQAWVEADTPMEAKKAAQEQAVSTGGYEDTDPDDFDVLAVYEGHITDYSKAE
jgi:hypothetical protein